MTSPTLKPPAPRLRQVAVLVHDLEAAIEDAVAVLGVAVAHRDPGSDRYGLANAILPIGDTFLEIATPRLAGTPADRFLRRRGADCGYMVCLQTTAPTEPGSWAARIIEDRAYEGGRTWHLHPKDLGGAILSVDACATMDNWHWAGADWRRHAVTEVSTALVGAEIRGADPKAIARAWATITGGTAVGQDGVWALALEGAQLQFIQSSELEGDGLSGLVVAVRDPEVVLTRAESRGCLAANGRLKICGLEIVLTVTT